MYVTRKQTLMACNEQISHAFFPWLYPMYIASSLAEPVPTPENQTMPDSASLRSFAEQRYLTFRSSVRHRSIKNRVATASSQDYM